MEEKKKFTLSDLLLGILGILAILAIYSWPIMALWNGMLTELATVPKITYQQAFGLATLTFCFGRCAFPAR